MLPDLLHARSVLCHPPRRSLVNVVGGREAKRLSPTKRELMLLPQWKPLCAANTRSVFKQKMAFLRDKMLQKLYVFLTKIWMLSWNGCLLDTF